MHTTTSSLRFAAIATAVTAVTTILLWLLPLSGAGRYADAAGLFGSRTRLWVNFAHVFLALVGYAAAASVAALRSPALAWASLAAFSAWTLTEALVVSMRLWATQEIAANPAAHLVLVGLENSLFFVVLVTFLIGTVTLGLGLLAAAGYSRVISTLLLLGAPLTVAILLDGYFEVRLSDWVNWVYPLLQPLSRAAMAVWLWREAAILQQLRKGALM